MQSSRKTTLILVLPMVAVSVLALVFGLRGLLLTDSAEALVVSDVKTSCDTGPDGGGCSYTVMVRFQTDTGRVVTAEAPATQEAFGGPGGTMTVVYYPDNPSEVTLRGFHWVSVGFGLVVGLLLLVLMLVVRLNR